MVGATAHPLTQDAPSGRRAFERCRALGKPPFTDSVGGLDRRYLTAAHAATIAQVSTWMIEAGMTTRLDPFATVIGRYEGNDPDAPALVFGSHIDSVPNGGVFDGPLGVMLGIEVVAQLHVEGTRFPFPIEVVAFGDEEGSRFNASMMASRAMAGVSVAPDLQQTDKAGIEVGAALSAFDALLADVTTLRRQSGGEAGAARSPSDVATFVEAHIEQGPVLEAEGLALGVVTAIAGQLRYAVDVRGRAAHAGTTTMALRRDALAAAAAMVMATEEIAQERSSDGVVATVGKLEVFPGGSNVIPGRVAFTLDIRAPSNEVRDAAAAAIEARMGAIARARGLDLSLEKQQDLSAMPCDPQLNALLGEAVASVDDRAFDLFSGAGHDAMSVAKLCPVTMLFIRCDRGISHHPDENILPEDAEQALKALLAFTRLYEGHRYAASVR